MNPEIEKLDDKIVFENYLRVQVNEHLKDLYRWGVVFDPENVYFTNSKDFEVKSLRHGVHKFRLQNIVPSCGRHIHGLRTRVLPPEEEK